MNSFLNPPCDRSGRTLRRHRVWPLGTLVAALLMTGCVSTGVLPTADLKTPPSWQQGSTLTASQAAQQGVLSPWWLQFNDPQLVGLIDQALARNNNLAQAAVKVRRAQLVAGQAASNQLPTLSAKGSATASRQLDGGPSTRLSTATAAVSWEVDLWGRLAALRDAADWEAQATEQDRQAAAMSLVGTVANLYWQIAYLNQRVVASQQSIDYARQTVKLVQAQYGAGSTSGLEVAQAIQALAAQEASHTQWLQQRVQARNALAILFDGPPGAALSEAARLPDGALPDVQPGLPASLLTRRPDLRAAELRLREALSTVESTRASAYPVLSLTGSVGGTSAALSKVLSDPTGTLGAGLVLPFVQWRDVQRAVDVSKADYEVAVLGYRQAWYQALSDTETALSARVQLDAQADKLRQAVQAARDAERLSEVRYRAGSVALKTWLDAQETRRQAENNLAQVQLSRLGALVTVYQAVGGGLSPTPS